MSVCIQNTPYISTEHKQYLPELFSFNVLYLGKVTEFLPLNSSFIILVTLQPDDANLLKFKLRRVYRFGLGFYPPKNLKIKSFYEKNSIQSGISLLLRRVKWKTVLQESIQL